MNELVRVFKTFVGYLQRPDLYPELLRKIKKNTLERKNATKGKNEALLWAKKNAISTENFITTYLKPNNYTPFNKLFVKEFNHALQKEKKCPVKMGGAGNLDLLYYISEKISAKNILETGVAYGWSSLACLLSLKNRNGALYSSDMPYLSQNGDNYVGYVVPQSLQTNWKLYRYADKESLPKIIKKQTTFEVIHYDSDKSYNGRLWAYNLLFKHLISGGYFISDDITDNAAFMDFCKSNNLTPSVIEFEDKYIGVIIKA